jgi:hypothetical protein
MPSSTFSPSTVSSTNADASAIRAGGALSVAPRRGCTRPGRLARLDAILGLRERPLILRRDGAYRDAPFVDVGVGEWPWTTLEAARSLRAISPELHVIGVELDPHRLRHAQRFDEPGLEFRAGGFDLPLMAAERPRLVRALNLLREYTPDEVRCAHLKLGAALLPGGLLLEGTSSATGGVLCVHLLRKRGAALVREGLLFSTDYSQGFAPFVFRDHLPRDFRRRCGRGTAIHTFLATWTESFNAARSTGLQENAALFAVSAQLLSRRMPGIVCDAALLEHGGLIWEPPGGVPSPELSAA